MPDRPNILLICTDQQRRDTMACYGNDWVQSPNVNALADESFVFENCYVTVAVCSPARASLLTGLYPHTAGVIKNSVPLLESAPSIATLAPTEYRTAKFGKWHLGNDLVSQHGFDDWVATEDEHESNPTHTRREDRFRHSEYFEFLKSHGYEPHLRTDGGYAFSQQQRSMLPEKHTMATFLGDNVADFIRRNTDQPWLMCAMFFEPHPPYNGPFNDLYDPDEIPVGPAFLRMPDDDTPLWHRRRAAHHLSGEVTDRFRVNSDSSPSLDAGAEDRPLRTAEDWRALRARYFGLVTLMDHGVGRVLDALEESGQADRTVVVFTSDHGDGLGDRGMLGTKRAFYEEIAGVPLLVRAPWISRSQKKIEGNIGHVDIVPTLLELMGVGTSEMPDHLQGRSRVDVLKGQEGLCDDVFMQWYEHSPTVPLGTPDIERMSRVSWRSVVTADRWKLNLSPGDQCELYDLNTDPFELNNRFDDPECRDRIRDMTARIRIWQQSVDDKLVLPPV